MTQRALAGQVVVEMGGNIAGPYAGWILAELGAEVFKIERPEVGDDARDWGPPFWRGAGTFFQAINRGKKSVALDLKDEAQRARLRRFLTGRADILMQNMRAGVLSGLGLDPAALRADNPRLIVCNLAAFGARGPLAPRPGYDALMQAFSGIMQVTGQPDGGPVRCGISVVDKGTAMWCVIGILAALQTRAAGGEGGIVDASLFETALAWMNPYALDVQVTGEAPMRQGSGAKGLTPYRAFRCADGELMVGAPSDRLFARLAEALGHREWAADERFAKASARIVNRDVLNAAIDDAMAQRPRAAWQQALEAAGVPNAPIQSIAEVLDHPQTNALDFYQASDDPRMRTGGLPLSWDGERPAWRGAAPDLGADTAEFLARADES